MNDDSTEKQFRHSLDIKTKDLITAGWKFAEDDFLEIIERISQRLRTRLEEIQKLGEHMPRSIDIYLDYKDGLKIDGNSAIIKKIKETFEKRRREFLRPESGIENTEVFLNIEGYNSLVTFPRERIL